MEQGVKERILDYVLECGLEDVLGISLKKNHINPPCCFFLLFSWFMARKKKNGTNVREINFLLQLVLST